MKADALYRFAWRHVPHIPTKVGYALFNLGADAAWGWHRARGGERGVGQLEKNLARLLPDGTSKRDLQRSTRAGMRSYMRYFYEAFALPAVSEEQLLARVRGDLDPELANDLSSGSVILAMPHMGNWDLTAAWACRELATVLTVAEKLEPADLFRQFVDFREKLGMRIIGQAPGEKVFDQLLAAAQTGTFVVPLLADRDLSSSGVQVDFAGHPARFAAGPAALAAKLDRPLYTATMHYERLSGDRRKLAGTPWGIVLTARKVPTPQGLSGRARIATHTQAWATQLAPMLAAHAQDWHMLQPVFDEDLDMDRLRRRHERENGAEPDTEKS